MRFGVYVPTSNEYDVQTLMLLAREAEDAGWDGFFVWDNLLATFDGSGILADTTVALTAIALNTERMRIGSLVTPIPRRRPWKLAKETATLDHLSGGRFTLGVGLGGKWDFTPVGEIYSGPQRAVMLDEGLQVISGLWSGRRYSFFGRHYALEAARLLPAPLQQPRIPVWVAGYWPGVAPFRRAAQWDGVVPLRAGHQFQGLTPAELRSCAEFTASYRTNSDMFDVIFVHTSMTEEWDLASEYEKAGAT